MVSEAGQVLLATRSRHKAREIAEILNLARARPRILTLDDAGLLPDREEDSVERFATFAANALAKAEHFCQRSGLPVIADDSGLCVDALAGRPGVRSRRFAGRDDLTGDALDRANNEALLAQLAGVPVSGRTARYVCAAAFVQPGAVPATALGSVSGLLLDAPAGEGGFGYDPLFFVPGLRCTFAQVGAAVKHGLSHRGSALRALAPLLARS